VELTRQGAALLLLKQVLATLGAAQVPVTWTGLHEINYTMKLCEIQKQVREISQN
jgi:hypothetical protein